MLLWKMLFRWQIRLFGSHIDRRRHECTARDTTMRRRADPVCFVGVSRVLSLVVLVGRVRKKEVRFRHTLIAGSAPVFIEGILIP